MRGDSGACPRVALRIPALETQDINLGAPWEVGTESPVPELGLRGIEWEFPDPGGHPSRMQ